MSEREERYEYGYRAAGRVVWEIDHGPDGIWTPWQSDLNIAAVDIYDGSEIESIRRALADAGVEGVVIRRRVTTTYGDIEEIPHDR